MKGERSEAVVQRLKQQKIRLVSDFGVLTDFF